MLELKKITKEDLKRLYEIEYTSEQPRWKEYNAPYFDDFKFISFDEFLEKESSFYLKETCRGIFVNGEIIGCVTRYWEDEKTRWLKIGIVIFDENFWGKGYGTEALKIWISKVFDEIKNIESIGLTTWSGNFGMIKVSEKLGMTLEARFRKVRYYKGKYYDSISYGILRDEWENPRVKL